MLLCVACGCLLLVGCHSLARFVIACCSQLLFVRLLFVDGCCCSLVLVVVYCCLLFVVSVVGVIDRCLSLT